MKSKKVMHNILFFVFLVFSFVDYSILAEITHKKTSGAFMKKVENIRLKLNDIHKDLKNFNHNILIQEEKLNIRTGSTNNKDAQINKKDYANNSVFSQFMDVKSTKIANKPPFFSFINININDPNSRVIKLVLVIFLVAMSSILCFILVKSSVDWAGTSKMDLNKMRDEELSKTTDEINLAYNVNRHYGD